MEYLAVDRARSGLEYVWKKKKPSRTSLEMEGDVPDLVLDSELGGDSSLSPRAPLAAQESDFEEDVERVRYEISLKEDIVMTVVVKNGEVRCSGKDLGEVLAIKLSLEKDSRDNNNRGEEECKICEEEDDDDDDSTDTEDFEDCQEAVTDFGCGTTTSGYYCESPLQTIEEEEEEDEDSELEQFEQLEQLCSSDDFDPDDLLTSEESPVRETPNFRLEVHAPAETISYAEFMATPEESRTEFRTDEELLRKSYSEFRASVSKYSKEEELRRSYTDFGASVSKYVDDEENEMRKCCADFREAELKQFCDFRASVGRYVEDLNENEEDAQMLEHSEEPPKENTTKELGELENQKQLASKDGASTNDQAKVNESSEKQTDFFTVFSTQEDEPSKSSKQESCLGAKEETMTNYHATLKENLEKLRDSYTVFSTQEEEISSGTSAVINSREEQSCETSYQEDPSPPAKEEDSYKSPKMPSEGPTLKGILRKVQFQDQRTHSEEEDRTESRKVNFKGEGRTESRSVNFKEEEETKSPQQESTLCTLEARTDLSPVKGILKNVKDSRSTKDESGSAHRNRVHFREEQLCSLEEVRTDFRSEEPSGELSRTSFVEETVENPRDLYEEDQFKESYSRTSFVEEPRSPGTAKGKSTNFKEPSEDYDKTSEEEIKKSPEQAFCSKTAANNQLNEFYKELSRTSFVESPKEEPRMKLKAADHFKGSCEEFVKPSEEESKMTTNKQLNVKELKTDHKEGTHSDSDIRSPKQGGTYQKSREKELQEFKESDKNGRVQSFRQYQKLKQEGKLASPESYTKQLTLLSEGGRAQVLPLDGGWWSIGGGERSRGPEIDSPPPPQREDIFRRGYDFGRDGWFAGGHEMRTRSEEADGSCGPAIRSALKRPGPKKRKKNKVQFDESLNKFFDADYVILIREEGECEGEGCGCGGYFYEEDDDQEVVLPPPIYPPVEFNDTLTLSPPDGYKDHLPGEIWEEERTEGEEEPLDSPVLPPPPLRQVEDNTTQTTPTSDGEGNSSPPLQTDHWYSPPNQNANHIQESGVIVETITMTTVTERRIVRETSSSPVDAPMSEPGQHQLPYSQHQQQSPYAQQQSPYAQQQYVRTSPDPQRNGDELTLTFRLGVPVAANSLKPNSAVRQLFPSPRFVSPPPNRSPDEPETGKKSPESDEDDGLQNNLIKRTIERNTLRRSLVRYPSDIRLRRNQNKMKNENSLVERIKKLTCDLDDEPERYSPPGEESKVPLPAYRKITDLFRKDKEPHPAILQTVEHQYPYYQPVYSAGNTGAAQPPDLGNGGGGGTLKLKSSLTTEARKQFLSSLAPLTACVGGNPDDLSSPNNRDSTASSSTAETEYSLNDIEDALKVGGGGGGGGGGGTTTTGGEQQKPQPDVVAGTPGNEHGDELALFVEQDASRIERIRKRYASSSDDEHDDYGFNRRPSVRGIKPRFGSTTEILQQMQSQMSGPAALVAHGGSHVSWPYYAAPEAAHNGYHHHHHQHHHPATAAPVPVVAAAPVRRPVEQQAHPHYPPYVVESPRRQVVVRGTQTISTYYHQMGPGRQVIRGPLVYYPRSPIPCSGSPTKGKLEQRGVPEGASSSPGIPQEVVGGGSPFLAPAVTAGGGPNSAATPTMMYAMNV